MMKTVSDLAFDCSGHANYVYIIEYDKYTPFIVLTDNYYGKTLLIRKDVAEKQRNINEYSSYYGNSEIDSFLNGEYLEGLGEFASHIITTDVEITRDDALGTSGLETETIDRKIFLLSCKEVGISDSVNMALEGKTLDYFKNEDNRNAFINGKPCSWWLRTPNTYFLSCTYVIGDNNKLGSTNAYDKNGIRPAFCVEGKMKIEHSSDIVDGQKVYVFSFEN